MRRSNATIDIERLVRRESELYGIDADIIHREVYWPVRVVSASVERRISPELLKVLKFIVAGYSSRELLEKRLASDDLDKHLRDLIQVDLIRTTTDGGYEANTASIARRDSEVSPVHASVAYYDAVSGCEIPLPEGIKMDATSKMAQNIPILAFPPIGADDEHVRYLRCLAILMSPKTGRGFEVRVICGYDRVSMLEEILYDLLIDDSPRLTGTGLVKPHRPLRIEAVIEEQPVSQSSSESIPRKPKRTPKPVPESRQVPHAALPDVQMEITRGKEMHQEVLLRCLSEATATVIIVTPFIRSMLDNARFIYSAKRAVDCGVKITVIHGMPESRCPDEDVDERDREDSRIQRALDQVNRRGITGSLNFCRVTDLNRTGRGDHSKILVCDCRWAVISSYNWLSIPENRDETGILIHDQRVISELVALYKHYLDG